MANTNIIFAAPSGLSPVVYLYPDGSDTVANLGGDSGTERTNAKGLYTATISESISGLHFVVVKVGTAVIGNYWVKLQDDTNTYKCSDLAIPNADDIYHADIDVVFDDGSDNDEYTITWFKDGSPVTSGITVPTIQVIKQYDASDLVASSTPVQVGSTGVYKHTETSNRMVAGEAYIVKVTATIDGSTRTWQENNGRDSTT